MEISLPASESKVLNATLDRNGTELVLKLVGAADLRIEKYFESVLDAVHAEAQKIATQRVVVNVKELNFINSACLKTFVVWISNVRQLGDAAYKIVFRQNESISWQQRSINSLKAFGEEVVTVE